MKRKVEEGAGGTTDGKRHSSTNTDTTNQQTKGAKRPADHQRPDEATIDTINAYLDNLTELARDTCREILLFEPDYAIHEVAEVFSPPRVVTVARQSGLKGGWSVDRLVERMWANLGI